MSDDKKTTDKEQPGKQQQQPARELRYVGPPCDGIQKIVLPRGRPVQPHLMTPEEIEAFRKARPEYAWWWE